MVLRNAFIVNELIKLGMKLKKRLTQIVMSNRDIREIHRMAQSRTYRFRQRFLGGKTSGQIQDRLAARMVFLPFAIG